MNIAIIGADAESVHAIKTAHDLGHRVICVDKDPHAGGVACADRVIKLDISLEEEVIKALRDENIDFVMTTPIGRHLLTIGAVNDALRLPGISRECALLCTDKYAFHNRLRNVKLRTGHCYLVGDSHPVDLNNVTYPAVFKPRYGSHGRSVHYLSDREELAELVEKIWGGRDDPDDGDKTADPGSKPGSENSRKPVLPKENTDSSDEEMKPSQKAVRFMEDIKKTMENVQNENSAEDKAQDDYMIEDALPGIEYAVDGVVEGCNFEPVLIRKKTLTPPPARQAVSYMNLMPGDNPRAESQIREYMGRLCEVIGFRECMLHADICIQGRIVNVIEISASPAGRHVYDELIPMATGVDMAREFIRYMAGDSHNFQPLNKKRMLLGYFDMENCFIYGIPDEDDIRAHLPKGVKLKKWECNIKLLDYMGRITDENSLLSRGCFLMEGENEKDLYDAVDLIKGRFDVK